MTTVKVTKKDGTEETVEQVYALSDRADHVVLHTPDEANNRSYRRVDLQDVTFQYEHITS